MSAIPYSIILSGPINYMLKKCLYIISAIIFLCACKKETGIEGPAGRAGNNGLNGNLLDTGTLSGNLAVYNEFSFPLSDSSGVNVSLQLSGATISTTSDHSGNYSFHGLPAGTYDLVYTKPNFGTMKVFGVSHSPGTGISTTVPEVYILQTPVKTAVDSISLFSNGTSIVLTIYMDTSSLSYVQYWENFALLIGSNPQPSPENTTLSPLNESINTDGHGAYVFSYYISGLGGNNQPNGPYYISVGTYNRYIAAYNDISSFFDPGLGAYYVDPSNGKFVYPNLKLSPNTVMVQ
jgi:hypothetical protein